MNDVNYLDSIIDDNFIECGKSGLFFDKKVTVERLRELICYKTISYRDSALEDDEEFKNAVDLLFEELEAEEPNHFAVRQYKKYKLAAGVV